MHTLWNNNAIIVVNLILVILMNIYDFDKTIYEKDSSIEFFKFCLKKNKKVLLVLPQFFIAMGLYYLKIIEKEKYKSVFFSFIRYFDDINKTAEDFWNDNNYQLKDFYLKQLNNSDIVISASPEFLLAPVAKHYSFNLIATIIDTKTGALISNNCYGKEKVKRLNDIGISSCRNFYSDSLSDEPLSKISRKAFIVKNNEVISWNEYVPSKISKIKNLFFSRDFITFVAIGLINAFNGVWIAYVYSLFIKNPIVAYIFGFCTSLCISYLLNSVCNFKEKITINKFYRFAISNIPNFIIQVLSVVLLMDNFHISKLIAYIISTVIAVPITFILIKMKVFTSR